MMNFKPKMKSMFFDSPKIASFMDKVTAKAFGRFGAYVRRVARNSIKLRKHRIVTDRRGNKRRVEIPSEPGSPPRSGPQRLLKDFIFFAYDPAALSVVIGPEKLNSKDTGAPEILEYGGQTTIVGGKKRLSRTIRIKPRPYMTPAFEATLPRLPKFWTEAKLKA